MKSFALFLVTILALQSTQAYSWGPDKYSDNPEEDSVENLELSLGVDQGLHVTGISYDGKFRLKDVTGQTASPFVISGPLLKKLGLDGFITQCEKYRKLQVFEVIHKDDNQYILEGEFYPLNKQSMTASLANLKDETIITEANLLFPMTEIQMGPHSQSAQLSSIDINEVIKPQIRAQRDQILRTGRIKIDLTGQDAFVCDLVTKKTQLIFATNLAFASALPRRDTAISTQELKLVIEKMENRAKSTKSARDALVVNSILQNEAMKEVINKDISTFDLSKFLLISNALVDGTTGQLKVKSSDSVQIRKVARSMDDVKIGMTYTNVMVYPNIQVKVY
jgi:hypothetical protein